MKIEATYKTLPSDLYDESNAEKFSQPKLLKFNQELSKQLGLDLALKSSKEIAEIFSGQQLLAGSEPFSMAYAGHQFGHFVPQLGDGRAMLLGEILDPQGRRFDVQLKGSGRTKYSRNGDGKSALGPVIREYIVSEAMYHLGVPTTRSLAAVATGDQVYRETPVPGAVLTRIASSHIRIGTFQFLACRNNFPALKALLDYSVQRHFPDLVGQEHLAVGFFKKVVQAQIRLVAQWMSIGFIHWVMNTDNMTISGETIDYGPCAFMDHFNFNQVYSYIDRNGRYAYSNQPKILIWNLARLADCLIPLVGEQEEESIAILNHELGLVAGLFAVEFNKAMAGKFGLENEQGVEEILLAWFEYLQTEKLDFTLSFRKLSDIIDGNESHFFPPTELFGKFESRWRAKIHKVPGLKQKMDALNPLFIPRNHQIEKAIQRATIGDYSIFDDLNHVLSQPFSERHDFLQYSVPPKAEEIIKNTFCGT
jgi:serine/tyrosine/threonine adenylyltransferase